MLNRALTLASWRGQCPATVFLAAGAAIEAKSSKPQGLLQCTPKLNACSKEHANNRGQICHVD